MGFLKKNRISSNKINVDKHKEIDGYVNKLTNVMCEKYIIYYMGIYDLLNNMVNEIKNKTNMTL